MDENIILSCRTCRHGLSGNCFKIIKKCPFCRADFKKENFQISDSFDSLDRGFSQISDILESGFNRISDSLESGFNRIRTEINFSITEERLNKLEEEKEKDVYKSKKV